MAILITGGAGFIGSHTVVELVESGEQVVVADNFENSSFKVIDNLKKIVGSKFKFYKGDCCCLQFLERVFSENEIESVVHFAGLKAVGESVKFPIKYYENNLMSTLNLLKVMENFNCFRFIFSSSATVYGDVNKVPFDEDMSVKSTNPYGETKVVIEKILQDVCLSNLKFSAVCLRYFNPIGAHKSGLIGEEPLGVPNNLMPYIVQVAKGKLECLNIFGNDYEDTKDGTGVRDYIHVVDLSLGHVSALDFCRKHTGFDVFNLGTGVGYSVLDVVESFEKVSGVKIKFKFVKRRPGDVSKCYCNPKKAKNILKWQPKFGLNEMCLDAWNFAKKQL